MGGRELETERTVRWLLLLPSDEGEKKEGDRDTKREREREGRMDVAVEVTLRFFVLVLVCLSYHSFPTWSLSLFSLILNTIATIDANPLVALTVLFFSFICLLERPFALLCVLN